MMDQGLHSNVNSGSRQPDDRRLLSPPPRPAVAGIPSAEEPPCPALAAGLLRPSPRFEVSSVVSVAGVVGCSVHSGAVLCSIFFRFASPKARKTMTTISALLATKPVGAPFGNVEVPTRPDSLPSMQTSAMGKVLVDANKLLTAPQRRAVIGMGHPLLLGYWLLSNLDLHSMSLRLPNEVATPMDEDANDVATPMDEDAVEAVLDEKSAILNSFAGIMSAPLVISDILPRATGVTVKCPLLYCATGVKVTVQCPLLYCATGVIVTVQCPLLYCATGVIVTVQCPLLYCATGVIVIVPDCAVRCPLLYCARGVIVTMPGGL
nr:hypothetical protein Iba_chr03aCG6250 [Ipomoea batatas]